MDLSLDDTTEHCHKKFQIASTTLQVSHFTRLEIQVNSKKEYLEIQIDYLNLKV